MNSRIFLFLAVTAIAGSAHTPINGNSQTLSRNDVPLCIHFNYENVNYKIYFAGKNCNHSEFNEIPLNRNFIHSLSYSVTYDYKNGRLSGREAFGILARITSLDSTFEPGHPFEFHGGNWFSYGHWIHSLGFTFEIPKIAVGNTFSNFRFDQKLVKIKLAKKKGSELDISDKKLSKNDQVNLGIILSDLEEELFDRPEFMHINPQLEKPNPITKETPKYIFILK